MAKRWKSKVGTSTLDKAGLVSQQGAFVGATSDTDIGQSAILNVS